MKYGLLFVVGICLVGCATTPDTTIEVTQTPQYVVVTEGSTPSEQGDSTPSAFPTPLTCQAMVIEQPFQNGRMFWIGKSVGERCKTEHDFAPGSGEIWVAIFDAEADGGEWTAYTDSWIEGSDPENDPTLTPPAGTNQPVRGFGRVWRDELSDEMRNALGWAIGPELAHLSEYRYDAGGLIDADGKYVPRPGQHTLVSMGDERFFFDEQTQTFDYIPGD